LNSVPQGTTQNESLQSISNDNVVRFVKFVISKSLTVKSTTFPHHDISTALCVTGFLPR
jgi:hypothetical protein